MNNPLDDNIVFETGRTVVKGIVQEAKKQVLGKKDDKKLDPVTGKPVPSKKALTQLSQATAQLQQIRLKQVREELEKQKLKISEEKKPGITGTVTKKPIDDAVQRTLKASKSTGEFGRQVGG